MKKRKFIKSLFTFLCMIGMIFTSIVSINAASSVTIDAHGDRWRFNYSGVFTDRYLGKSQNITSLRIDNFTVNGQNAYCIEPLVEIYPYLSLNTLSGQDALNALYAAGYSDETIELMTKIATVGYGFNGDVSESMNAATQLRIWQVSLGEANTLNIPAEIQEKVNVINQRLYEMQTHFSFEDQTIEINGYGQENATSVTDSNGVLQAYIETSIPDGIHMERNGNTLTLWADRGSDLNGSITFDSLYTDRQQTTPIVYTNAQTQSLATFSKANPRVAKINYVVNEASTGKIHIEKTGETLSDVITTTQDDVTKTQFVYEEKSLSNISFQVLANEDIYDKDNNLVYAKDTIVDTMTTTDGICESIEIPFGTYRIEEVESLQGLVLNSDPIYVTINDENTNEFIVIKNETIYNRRQKVQLNLKKVSSSTNSPLSGALFGLYSTVDITDGTNVLVKAGTLLETATSNEEGNIVFEADLPISIYELKELKAPDGYSLNENPIVLDLTTQSKSVDVIEINEDIKNDFQLVSININKIDSKTKKAIAGKTFEFGLYKDVNCTDLIEKKSSDSGFVEFTDLDVGTYYIKETKAPTGYKLSDEIVTFDIQEYGQVYINGKKATTNESLLYSIDFENEQSSRVATGIQNNSYLFILFGVTSLLFLSILIVRKFRGV